MDLSAGPAVNVLRRNDRVWLLLLALLAAGGCASDPRSTEQIWAELQGSQAQELIELYPPGTPRSEIRSREHQRFTFSVFACDLGGGWDDPFFDLSLADFRSNYPGLPPACDRVRLGRTGWFTLIGGVRLFQDYVFYDEFDRVLVAYRAILRRSSAR